MSIRNALSLCIATVAAFLPLPRAAAVDYTWNVLGGGPQAWNSAANWNPSTGIPNASADTVNFGVGLAADLTVDLDAVTTSGSTIIGSGTFGGTSSAVTTNVTGTSYFILGQSAQATNVQLTSGGVAGSVNRISAPVLFGKNTDITNASTRDFTIASPVIGQTGVAAVVSNLMTTGQTLTIGSGSGSLIQLYEVLVPGNARNFTIQNFNNSSGTAAQTTVVNATWGGGPSATGQMIFGNSNQNPAAVYRLMLSQTSPANVVINRQAYELLADNVFGTGTVTSSNNNNQNWGASLKAVGGDRSIGNAKVLMSNPFAFTGTNSVTVTGVFTQGSNRVLGNNLPNGKQVNLNGVVAMDNTTSARTMTFDGTGKTVINGQIINNITGDNVPGTVLKKGAGRLEVMNATNTLSGTWQANGGLIVFGTAGSHGTAVIRTGSAGGVSYAPGTADAGWAAFAAKLTGSGTNFGFLALPAADATANLDFTTTLAGAPSLSVVGDGDMTFTGVVTPGSAGYNWGGTTGVLTLPANASTGATTATYTNGGTVVIAGSQSYTGATTVQGVQIITAQAGITSGTGASTAAATYNLPTTLTVDSLGNAGSASSLGASSNSASNLVIDRATLRVTGGSPSSTDRLFTVGPNGATIENAGAGVITLGSGGGANAGPSSAAVLTLTGTGNGILDSILADGGGVLSLVKAGSGTWTLNGISTYSGTTSVSAGKLVVNGVLGSGSVGIASGATVAGTGTIATLVFGAGSTLTFDPASTLTVSSTARFQSPSTFGVDDIIGLSSSTPDGIYTLIAGNVDTTGLANFGSSNAYDLGAGKSAWFQAGSLQLVVVPEPTSVFTGLASLGLAALLLRRRAT
jgi:fibronectin-binding autotransporter adhesin